MAKGETKETKELKEMKLKDDEVIIKGEKIQIKPSKIKYMINDKKFLTYQVIEQVGIIELFNYSDGYDLIKSFLISVFDNEEYVDSIIDDLDVETIENIIKISKKVNKIKDEENQLKNAIPTPKEV